MNFCQHTSSALEDGGQELALLLLRAPHHNGGHGQNVVHVWRDPGPVELLLNNGLVVARETAAAVLRGEGGIQPTLGRYLLVLLPPVVAQLVREVHLRIDGLLHILVYVILQPGSHLLPEPFLLFRIWQRKVHDYSPPSFLAYRLFFEHNRVFKFHPSPVTHVLLHVIYRNIHLIEQPDNPCF